MDGVTFQESESGALVCHIESLSDELKGNISKRLSEICYGAAKAASQSEVYAYKLTLKEFLKRYESKTDKIKKGMVGELLTHVLLMHFVEKYSSINPYFNMEEESIKKAFDLVLRDSDTGELWYSEVKSGEVNNQTSIEKTKSLLSTAKSELKEKLNSSRHALWENAINGAIISIQSAKLKGEIQKILEECNLAAVNENSKSKDHNAIVISVLYRDLDDSIEVEAIDEKHKRMVKKNEFKGLLTFAVQKETYQAVVNFLSEEVVDG